jgi:hypothetical protein
MNSPGASKTPTAWNISVTGHAFGIKTIRITAVSAAQKPPASLSKTVMIRFCGCEKSAPKGCLTKASPLSRLPFMEDNRLRLKRAVNHLPRGHLYDISGIF